MRGKMDYLSFLLLFVMGLGTSEKAVEYVKKKGVV